ncbi:MAG: hypothetical protein HY847_03465 [Betaproteobacteria bacterium]|nr:hypothetical protein [Betaproteobacteria bacterium]
MKTKFLLAALTVALTTSLAVIAADEPVKEAVVAPTEQPAKAEPAKPKVKPHSHLEAKGYGPMAVSTEAKEQPKRPPHDHLKFHKHM